MKIINYCILILLLIQACLAPAYAKPHAAGKIKHVVVLMEENRSFDHFFGFFKGVNGLNGTEYNLVNVSDPNSKKIYVDDKGPFVAPCDPDHSTPATTFKIFGSASDAGKPTMSGFVNWEGKSGNSPTNYCAVMSSQSPSHLPIMSALSEEFVLMDMFFCAHPGPTWPNRLFMLSATSAGCTETSVYYHDENGALYPQKTFFDQVSEAGLTWKNYYNDTPWEMFLETIAKHPENQANMEQFYEDAKTGNLPSFSWINPRAGMNTTLKQGSNDQHPDHDVALGERYYKDIYEALRASPAWNDTLYVITYDEHGGFYDHVSPPVNIPPPGDNETSYPDKGVLFNRLGIRIPTLLISPWLPKGMVLSGPPAAQMPASNSEYTLTSIMATARILLGMPSTPLTQRDAWSATFENLFDSYAEPRTDCPEHLPAAPPPANITEELLPVNDLQKKIMEMHANLAGVEFPVHVQRQGQVSEWLQQQYAVHLENTAEWKRSKETRAHTVTTRARIMLLHSSPASISLSSPSSSSWTMSKSERGFFTLSTHNAMCLDHAEGVAGVSRCYPHASASASLDATQQWVWRDATVRPRADESLCLTKEKSHCGLVLRQCTGAADQMWAFAEGQIISEEKGEGITVVAASALSC